MSRSSSPGCFSGAGDECYESEFEFPSKADRVRWKALGLDEFYGDSDGSGEGYAPRFLSRSGEGSAPRGDEESASQSERHPLGASLFSRRNISRFYTHDASKTCRSSAPGSFSATNSWNPSRNQREAVTLDGFGLGAPGGVLDGCGLGAPIFTDGRSPAPCEAFCSGDEGSESESESERGTLGGLGPGGP